jgi:hypothetical protein
MVDGAGIRGFELLEHACEARAKLLSVERLPAVGGDEQLGAAFLLVFDVGRILLAPETGSAALFATHLEDADDVPTGMLSSIEDEPWWRVLGAPVCGLWAESGGSVLRLQLRDDSESPRFVTLACEGEAVRSALARGAN